MPATITLSNVTCSTPDDRPLFSNLDLTFGPERTGLVGRNGVGKTKLLQLIAADRRPHSGSITVGGTLGRLRQTVRIDPADTIADLFGVADALTLLRRAERGEAGTEEVTAADWTLEARIASALARVGGARPPPLLILDEPTNHLDIDSTEAVEAGLRAYDGALLVVSHDAAFLEAIGMTRRLDLPA